MPGPKVNTPCPDLAQFQRLVSAQLSDIDKEAILHHLESCDACAEKIAALPEQDMLVGLIRHAHTPDEATGNMINRLVERLSELRPAGIAADGGQAPPRQPAPDALLSFACPSCGKRLKVKAELAGKKVRCPFCQGVALVRAAAAGASGAARSMPPETQSLQDRLTLGVPTPQAGGSPATPSRRPRRTGPCTTS